MKITISGKHISVGEALTARLEEKLSHLAERYLKDAIEATATVSKPTHLFETDIALHASHNLMVRAKGQDASAIRSAEVALEILEHRLNRHRKRLKDRRRETISEFLTAQQYVLSPPWTQLHQQESAEETPPPIIIAETTGKVLTLSVSEAVTRMDLADSPALLFRNAANGQFNMVYRRLDGNIGWVDPTQSPS